MKKILKYLFLGGSIFLFWKKMVSASSEFLLEPDPNQLTYKIETEEKTKQLYFYLVKDKETQELVYCLEPGVNLSNEIYEELKEWEYQKLNLSKEQKDFISKVAYFGYGYQNHQDINYYYAAQLLIWEKIIPASWNIYYTDFLGGQKVERFQQEKKEILNQMELDEIKPSFVNQSYSWNEAEPLILEDKKEQLQNYHLITQTNWNITQNQNTLKIQSKKGEQQILEFVKTYEGEPLKFYLREDGQNVFKRGNLEPKYFFISLNPYHLEIQVEKVDEEKNPIKDVIFELIAAKDIKNYQNQIIVRKDEKIATLQTDKFGKSVLSGLEQGSYCLKEIQAPDNYEIEKTPSCFTITKENPTKKILVINAKKKEDLIIYKKDVDTDEPLEQVHFQIMDELGNRIWSGVTNQEGKIEIKNLPLGKYQIIELKAKDGYIREPIPTTIILDGKEKETTVILRNQKKMQTLIIQKEDEETRKRLRGVKFLITNEQGKKIFQGETNEEGIIELENLHIGTYKITELESLDGYLIEKNPVTFQIDGTTKVKTITLTNRKIQSVPETYEKSLFPKIEYIPRKRRKK